MPLFNILNKFSALFLTSAGDNVPSDSRRSRLRQHPVKRCTNPSEMNGEMECVRRSTRHRRLMYDSFKQSLMDRQLPVTAYDDFQDVSPSRKRKRAEVEPLPDEEVEF